MKRSLSLLLILSMAFAPAGFAGDDIWTMAESEKYGPKAGGMLGRGLLNAASCFVDVIVQTVEGTQEGEPFVGTLAGFGGGLACTVLRAGSGVVDVATFWVPNFNGFPVSRSYSNCLACDAKTYAATDDYTRAVSYAKPSAPVSTSSVSVGSPSGAPVKTVADDTTYVDKGGHDPMKYVKK